MKTSIFKFSYAIVLASLIFAGCSKDAALSTKQDFRLNEEIHLAPMMDKQPGSKYIDGAYIVVFNDDVTEAEVDRESDRICKQRNAKKNKSFKYALKGFTVNLTAVEIEEVRKDPRVKYIEQDQLATAVATQASATWGLDRLDQPTLPLSGTYTYDKNGSTVDAYIFDTGIKLTHAEFTGRVSSGFNAITAGAPADDDNGHGSHVAGTVGGTTYGVAKGINLIAVKVLDVNGSGAYSGVIDGINWAIGTHSATRFAVGNMSLGGGASTAIDDAVRSAIKDGIVMCLAAGNSNVDAINSSPARTVEAITVGATTSADAKASFSNYGSVVDIFAPGNLITSAWHTSSNAINTISGTSMASPHVAGVAALYLENNLGTTTAEIEAALKSNAVTGLITGLPAGTANRLLQTSFSNLLSAPALPSPANTATNVSRTPTLSWGAVTGAIAYNVQYSTSSTFGTGTTSKNGVSVNSLYITTPLARRTKYFWRVQAVNGVWSNTWSFTTVR